MIYYAGNFPSHYIFLILLIKLIIYKINISIVFFPEAQMLRKYVRTSGKHQVNITHPSG